MIQIIRPKPSESDDEIGIDDVKTKETDSFDRAITITRYGMRLLGFWPQDTRLFCDLWCGAIFTLISSFTFPIALRTYTVVYAVTDWNSVMHQALEIVPTIPLLARFIFMKVMARNFRLVLCMMTADWADYCYLTKRNRQIMIYYARRGRRFSILSTILLALALIGFILTPIMNMWRNDSLWNVTTRILPHEGLYPFYNKKSPIYEMLYIAQLLVTFLYAMALVTVDCFLYIIVFHVCGQFDILATTLKRYDGSVRHHYMKNARNCACLSCIVKRHVHILSFVDIIEKSFRDFLLLQLLGYWLSLVLQGRELILHVRHSNVHGIITCIVFVLTIMYYIFIYCYVSECIIERSENIGRIAHDLEWQHFPRDSNLQIIAARTRMPCKLTAGRFLTLSFPCYNTVLIDVHYCALNISDALLSQNLYTFEPKLPMILGYEVVGKLIEVGTEAEKNGYKVGDKVIALNKERCGGLAEKCVAEVGDIWKVPSMKSASSVDLASTLDSYITALVALERKVSLNEEDMILINVGISGIGLAAVDLATNVFKAKVIGVCATEDWADRAREMGAFAALKYKDKKLIKQIEEIAAERDIKAIFEDEDGTHFKKLLSCFTDIYKDATLKDLLRNDNFAVVVHHLSREGRVIVAGTVATMMGASEAQKGSFSVTGFNFAEYKKKKPDLYRQAGDDVLQFLEEGLIAPSYSLIAGMHKVNDALRSISENALPGKVVIDMRDKEAEITKVVT